MADDKLKVKLTAVVPELDGNRKTVVFKVAPVVTESQAVQYQSVSPVHTPGAIQVFSGSNSRIFSVQPIKLISRNSYEAAENILTLNTIRAWTKPYFGATKGLRKELGSGPDVLLFSAYSEANFRGNIYRVPVVISNLGITYPDDVDYIPCGAGSHENTPFPTVMQMDVTLIETHSPEEYANVFDLNMYRQGLLENF